MNDIIQATAIVYAQQATAQRHFPVSFFIATKVATHGKYSRMKTMNDNAAAGVTSLTRALWSWVSSLMS